MWNDTYGRTSPTKFCGWFACMISVICFGLAGFSLLPIMWFSTRLSVDFSQLLAAFQNLMLQSIGLFSLGTALLVTQRLSKDKEVTNETNTLAGSDK